MKQWTEDTIACYKIGCTCSKCKIVPDDIKKDCRLKKTVIEFVTQLGAPIENIITKKQKETYLTITPQELEVLKLLPLENKEISEVLCFSKDELEMILFGLFGKFKVRTKAALLAKAIFHEIIGLSEALKCLK